MADNIALTISLETALRMMMRKRRKNVFCVRLEDDAGLDLCLNPCPAL